MGHHHHTHSPSPAEPRPPLASKTSTSIPAAAGLAPRLASPPRTLSIFVCHRPPSPASCDNHDQQVLSLPSLCRAEYLRHSSEIITWSGDDVNMCVDGILRAKMHMGPHLRSVSAAHEPRPYASSLVTVIIFRRNPFY